MSMKEFIDEVRYRRTTDVESIAAMCEVEPKLTGMPLYDAFIAGVSELLLGESAPTWAQDDMRFLAEPVFFGGKHSRAFAIQHTPIAMRKRLLFCGDIGI